MRTLVLGLALTFATTAPTLRTAHAESTAAMKPPKGFDAKNAKEHLTKHQTYPATKAELVASCNNLIDFSAEDKKWFSDSLPEGSYKSAADVIKVLHLK